MSDVLEDRRDLDAPRARLWDLIERTPSLDWLLLTKRPRGYAELVPTHWRAGRWPRNAWAGTTCGTQAGTARVSTLIDAAAGARIRFLSVEPLLGPIDFIDGPVDPESTMGPWSQLDDIQWVIVGAESGPHARPMEEAWARSVKDQCLASGTAFFLKQYADARGHKIPLPELDGRQWTEFPA
jgi:protein gp37